MDWPKRHHKAANIAERRLFLIVRRKKVLQRTQLVVDDRPRPDQLSGIRAAIIQETTVLMVVRIRPLNPSLSVRRRIRLVHVLLGQHIGTQVVIQEIASFHTEIVDGLIGDMN